MPSDPETKDVPITFRVTESFDEEVSEAADALGLDKASVARMGTKQLVNEVNDDDGRF